MKRLLLVALIAVLSAVPVLLPAPLSASASDPQQEAGAIVVQDTERTKVFKDFTYTTVEHERVTILNKRGVNAYCEVVLPYSTEYQRIEILDAKTLTPDGKILKPGKKGINDVTPPFIFSAPIYSDVKYRTITMPGCTPGATIDYTVRIRTIKPYMKGNFFDSDYLQTSDPISQSTYEVSFPRDVKFAYRQYNFISPPSIIERGDRVMYTWKLRGIKQIIPEQNMPPMSEVLNRVRISTVGSWDGLARWYWGLSGKQYGSSKAMDRKITKLTKGLTTTDEKIRAIYDYVSMNIRYVGLEFGIEGYKPHKAQDVFKNKYGDCKDHATLLIAMLRHIGVTAYPVLVDTAEVSKMDPSLPSPGQFDHEIVAIPQGKGFWFLDSTSDVTNYKDLPPMDQGRQVVVVQRDTAKIVETPIFSPAKNATDDVRTVTINRDGSLSVAMKLTYTGVYGMYIKAMLRGMKPIQRKTFLEDTASDVCPGAVVYRYTISNIYDLNIPAAASLDFTCQDYVIKAGNLLIVKVPTMSMQNLAQLVARDTRTYPLMIGYNFEKKNSIVFNIPDGYSIRYMPQNTSYKNQFGTFTINYQRLERHLGYTGDIVIQAYSVEPKDYPLIKTLFNTAVIGSKNQVVVFERLNIGRHIIRRRRRR